MIVFKCVSVYLTHLTDSQFVSVFRGQVGVEAQEQQKVEDRDDPGVASRSGGTFNGVSFPIRPYGSIENKTPPPFLEK